MAEIQVVVMAGHEELVKALAGLDSREFRGVINESLRLRGQVDLADRSPPPHPNREQFASWLARRHMASDLAIDEVIYLPAGAPEGEVRLLEIIGSLNVDDSSEIEPLDLTPEIVGISFVVYVADVSAGQWERAQARPEETLPKGWSLRDAVTFPRD